MPDATRELYREHMESGAWRVIDRPEHGCGVLLRGGDLQALSDDPDDLADDLQTLAGPSAGPGGGSIYVDGFSNGTLPPKESIREIVGFGRTILIAESELQHVPEYSNRLYVIEEGGTSIARCTFASFAPV